MYQPVCWLIAPDIGGPTSVPSEMTVNCIYSLLWVALIVIFAWDGMWTKNKSKEEKESRKPDCVKSKDTGTRDAVAHISHPCIDSTTHLHTSSPSCPPFLSYKSSSNFGRTMLLAALHIVVVAIYWLVLNLVVIPVEGLLRMNSWRAELRLTAGLTFTTIEHGEVFDRAIPMRIWFPQELSLHCLLHIQSERETKVIRLLDLPAGANRDVSHVMLALRWPTKCMLAAVYETPNATKQKYTQRETSLCHKRMSNSSAIIQSAIGMREIQNKHHLKMAL
ncbi:hypothetical protein EI94DRAFT_1704053 [Lactarius quietus]|nr:hypothetical protein EI94DRAFT_1704053 [Lactarius quietus]